MLINLVCSETKQKTLEEIAAVFGDKVVLVDERQVDVGFEEIGLDDRKGGVEHVEVKA